LKPKSEFIPFSFLKKLLQGFIGNNQFFWIFALEILRATIRVNGNAATRSAGQKAPMSQFVSNTGSGGEERG